jgi:hypothetical protein
MHVPIARRACPPCRERLRPCRVGVTESARAHPIVATSDAMAIGALHRSVRGPSDACGCARARCDRPRSGPPIEMRRISRRVALAMGCECVHQVREDRAGVRVDGMERAGLNSCFLGARPRLGAALSAERLRYLATFTPDANGPADALLPLALVERRHASRLCANAVPQRTGISVGRIWNVCICFYR